jgi:methyl-accepting chemotaxis protein
MRARDLNIPRDRPCFTAPGAHTNNEKHAARIAAGDPGSRKPGERPMNPAHALRRVRIGPRLAGGFGLVLALMAVAIVGADVAHQRIVREQVDALETTSRKLVLASSMKASLLEAAVAMRNIVMQPDAAGSRREQGRVKETRAAYKRARADFTALGVTPPEARVLGEVDRLDSRTDEPLDEVLPEGLIGDQAGAITALATRIDPLTRELATHINTLVDMQQGSARAAVQAGNASAMRTRFVAYLLGVVALAAGALCAWIFARSIVRPLRNAVDVAREVATGRLRSSHGAIAGSDEVAELLRALDDMTASLTRMVGGVRDGTDAVDAAAGEIARANSDLSGRTETQASFLEETAGSMEELTAAVTRNADSADRANELALNASRVAERGGAVVAKVVGTMGSIQQSSARIGSIIGAIDGIAFQTNILALNAAVEAARAGEEGRGFAVVAAEVRSLAQRSAEAARETKRLIDDSSREIGAGAALIAEAGRTMREIVESVGTLTGIVAEISGASAEQKRGIQQVNGALGQMDSMTQQNAAMVEEAAAVAQSLREQAAHLARSIAFFALERAGPERPEDQPALALAGAQ